jgi:pimeloyl-ACP methyl ester carboxylesterase
MKPVLLLIPGMLNTDAVWSRVIPLLAGQADVRIADVCSQSRIDAMARDAWALVADVPTGTPLIACGFSMGGYVAIEMQTHAHRRFDALALLCTSARPESPEGAIVRDKTIAAIEKNFAKVVEGVLAFGTHPDTQAQPVLMQELRELMLGIGADAAIRQNHAVKSRADNRGTLAQVDLPVLVIASRDDRIIAPAACEELASAIPNARLEWLSGAGHMAPIEQPEQVARHLLSLIAP